MPWIVTATGKDSGYEYVYRVDAPETASGPMVLIAAYAAHSKLDDPEYLVPPLSATWTEEEN